MTTLINLKKLTDSSLLVKEDWILLKYIATTEQNSFRPCLCTNPNKHGSILFTKDSLKTYSNPKHSAHGLGPVYNRFKCSALGCTISFAPVTMLIKYKESQEAPLINPSDKKRLYSQQEESRVPARETKSFLWSDVVDDIEMSQLESTNSQLNTQLHNTIPYPNNTITDSFHAPSSVSYPTNATTTESHHGTNATTTKSHQGTNATTTKSHQGTNATTTKSHHGTTADSNHSNTVTTTIDTVSPSTTIDSFSPSTTIDSVIPSTTTTDLSTKLDTLTTIILSMKTDSDSKMDFLLNSLGKLMSKNQDLEQKLANLSSRLELTEDKLTQISGMKATATLTTPTFSSATNTRTILDSTSYSTMPETTTALIQESITSTNTWASIARANPKDVPTLARAKAQENIRITDRAKLISQLSRVAKPRTIPDTNKSISQSVFVAGFDFIKIREIWKALSEARFQVSRIINIQWIGKSVLDIVVYDDYHLQFISELTLNRQFRLLTFNPSCNSRASTPAQNETAMRAFAIRCIKNITNSLNSPTCINHFKTISEEYCSRNPDLSNIFSQEWERIKLNTSTNCAMTIDSTTISVSTTNPNLTTDTCKTTDSTNHSPTTTNIHHDQRHDMTTNPTTHNLNNDTSITTNSTNCDLNGTISSNIDIEMEDTPTESSTTTADSTIEYGSGAH
jgi:hypothetical protein